MSDWEAIDACNNTEAGDLTIDDVPMNCAGWRVENLWVLWLPAKKRGQDKVRHGVNGVKPGKRRPDGTIRSLHLRITGWADVEGDEAASTYVGMKANLDYLRANVVDPPSTGITREAVLTMPGEDDQRTAEVIVLDLEVEDMDEKARECLATLDILIPEGAFPLPAPSP